MTHEWETIHMADGTPIGDRCAMCRVSVYLWKPNSHFDMKNCAGSTRMSIGGGLIAHKAYEAEAR